jgi:hypothetical protein
MKKKEFKERQGSARLDEVVRNRQWITCDSDLRCSAPRRRQGHVRRRLWASTP